MSKIVRDNNVRKVMQPKVKRTYNPFQKMCRYIYFNLWSTMGMIMSLFMLVLFLSNRHQADYTFTVLDIGQACMGLYIACYGIEKHKVGPTLIGACNFLYILLSYSPVVAEWIR